MSDDTDINGWMVLIIMVLLGFIVWICCSDNAPREGYFFVGGGTQGYAVMMDDGVSHTTRITKWVPLDDAKRVCDALNVELRDEANHK